MFSVVYESSSGFAFSAYYLAVFWAFYKIERTDIQSWQRCGAKEDTKSEARAEMEGKMPNYLAFDCSDEAQIVVFSEVARRGASDRIRVQVRQRRMSIDMTQPAAIDVEIQYKIHAAIRDYLDVRA